MFSDLLHWRVRSPPCRLNNLYVYDPQRNLGRGLSGHKASLSASVVGYSDCHCSPSVCFWLFVEGSLAVCLLSSCVVLYFILSLVCLFLSCFVSWAGHGIQLHRFLVISFSYTFCHEIRCAKVKQVAIYYVVLASFFSVFERQCHNMIVAVEVFMLMVDFAAFFHSFFSSVFLNQKTELDIFWGLGCGSGSLISQHVHVAININYLWMSVFLLSSNHQVWKSTKFPAIVSENLDWNTILCLRNWAASWQNQQNDCMPSEDSDQPGHLPSLIRVFAVHSMDSYGLKLSSCRQQSLRSDWADVQADPSLRWVHMPFCWFCHDMAQMIPIELLCYI